MTSWIGLDTLQHMSIHTSQLFDTTCFSLATAETQKQQEFVPMNPAMPNYSFTSQQVQCTYSKVSSSSSSRNMITNLWRKVDCVCVGLKEVTRAYNDKSGASSSYNRKLQNTYIFPTQTGKMLLNCFAYSCREFKISIASIHLLYELIISFNVQVPGILTIWRQSQCHPRSSISPIMWWPRT